MRTAIVYYSQHHGNTKKLLDAISDADITVTLINAAEKIEVDLRDYVFFIATCGSPRKNYFDGIKQLAKSRDCTDLGSYLCTGFDTFGPFKLIGGLKKGHPTEEEIQGAVDFYNGLGF